MQKKFFFLIIFRIFFILRETKQIRSISVFTCPLLKPVFGSDACLLLSQGKKVLNNETTAQIKEFVC